MEGPKVFPLVSLLCLVVVGVSLFNLIDMAEGASLETEASRASPSPKGGEERTMEMATKRAATPINSSSRQGGQEEEDEGEGRLLFVASNLMKKKKRLAAMRRNANSSSTTTIPSHSILSDKMDDGTEYSFDNGTLTSPQQNKTTTNTHKNPTPLQDYLCPEKIEKQRSGTNVQQSTLPAAEFVIAGAVHLIVFVIFLYFWKNIYYPVEDPYATVSPYGYGIDDATPLPPKGRSIISNQRLDAIHHTLDKSIIER